MTDQELETLWTKLGNIPCYEDEQGCLLLEERFLHFDKGTNREEVWEWFDNKYSKGVYALMYRSN